LDQTELPKRIPLQLKTLFINNRFWAFDFILGPKVIFFWSPPGVLYFDFGQSFAIFHRNGWGGLTTVRNYPYLEIFQ